MHLVLCVEVIVQIPISRNMDDYEIPVVDLTAWIGDQDDDNCEGRTDDCQRLADALHRFGIVLVRDPRVSEVDNDKFLDQMETYYERSDGVKDARPEVIHLKLKSYSLILEIIELRQPLT